MSNAIRENADGTFTVYADGIPTVYPTRDEAQSAAMDSDGDGLPDAVDPDDDNDGIPDEADSTPRTTFDVEDPDHWDAYETGQWDDGDADDDGIPDELDDDDDGDGLADSIDLDDDGDGIPDELEDAMDTDGDGTPDCLPVSNADLQESYAKVQEQLAKQSQLIAQAASKGGHQPTVVMMQAPPMQTTRSPQSLQQVARTASPGELRAVIQQLQADPSAGVPESQRRFWPRSRKKM
ncbi:MAG: hypothetical protein F4X54_07725 [Chloroflexi bacterium]|nr:hypothetical protein [Chloroflexota bacterium]